ncbi:shikimate dehydrogenase family protein [Streptomyces inhibens]|uniref:shikimate dehydrogenase family protein n=1 Tax=Streptomyces inhibens TaxID=2293571 RepID=UPI001EE73D39|nr:shikimate dehydrogenase [Streptomyces inhibens]UKY54179.1 shikimate dehydrogenase [Streptomyces inhibens]
MTTEHDTHMGFVGVTTGSSSIMKVFPKWAEVLGLPTRTLLGHDIGLGAPRETYRDVVGSITDDPGHRGALVTSHKIAVFEAARDLFDDLDDLARTFGEISSIAKRGTRLTGAAKDPVTVRLALEDFLPAAHFTTTGAAAVVLGSGGSGCALSHQLGVRGDRPSRVICTARSQERLTHQRQLHERAGIDPALMQYVVTTGPDDVDALLASLPPSSLVVNATGMGKDRPGSPVGNAGRFPDKGVVWEFNYRGTLEFLHQARAQQDERGLFIEDGWRYFVHGWTQVIADVFDIPMPRETVDELARVAAGVR